MIRYSLRCERGHEFDGWFRSSDDFDKQAGNQQLACAHCGMSEVDKAIMAPNVAPSGKRAAPSGQGHDLRPPQPTLGASMPPDIKDIARKLRQHVRENAEYVGPRFADEARRIHYEETEPHGIYGEATPQEAQALRDEGIEAFALPTLPDDAN